MLRRWTTGRIVRASIATLFASAAAHAAACSYDWSVPDDGSGGGDAASATSSGAEPCDPRHEECDAGAGAVTGGGGPSCTAPSDCATCIACAAVQCASAGTAAECEAFLACLAADCDGGPCMQDCQQDHTLGYVLWICNQALCREACGDGGLVPCE